MSRSAHRNHKLVIRALAGMTVAVLATGMLMALAVVFHIHP